MIYYVRIHWSGEDRWSGRYDCDSPEEALAKARKSISKKTYTGEDILNHEAHFAVCKCSMQDLPINEANKW